MTDQKTMPKPATPADLATCDKEPIHIPGSIQPHGALLVLADPDLVIEHVSANTSAILGKAPDELLGRPLRSICSEQQGRQVQHLLSHESLIDNPIYAFTLERAGEHPRPEPLNAVIHRHAGRVFLEFDPAGRGSGSSISLQSFYPLVRTSINRLEAASTLEDLYAAIAEEVRRIAGFDRVMIYQFDKDWHGWVVGEARAPDVTSYIDHHFPASDIPAQARNLYRVNRSRVIVDAAYEPVPLVSARNAGNGPIDMSYCVLRSVSRVHAEYLRNMGVAASTSFSIIRDGELWGLIACHHRTPLQVPFEIRTACEFLSQVVAIQIGAQIRRSHDQHRLRLQAAQNRLLAAMAREDNLLASLAQSGPQLLEFLSANGAALYFDKQITLLGATPTEAEVQRILDFVTQNHEQDVFTTDSLPSLLPEASAFKETACGVLAMSVSRFTNSYLLWFRPERIRTVNWGGDPSKPAEPQVAGARIHPRKSFENWKQLIENYSLPWLDEEIEAAGEFRSAVVNIVLRKVEELASLSAELRRANSELEAFSYSVSHDLRAPFRHIAGFSDLLSRRAAGSMDETSKRYVKTIGDAAKHAGALVDALLAFSHIARVDLRKVEFPLSELVDDVIRDLSSDLIGRRIRWNHHDLPRVKGDPTLLRLVLQNLLANAVKFTRNREEAWIEISAKPEGAFWRIDIRDNGAGFDPQYKSKLFTPFQRLHRAEDFEGTGIGLANVKRIIERHGGMVGADSAPDKGATFHFTLPVQEHAQ